MTLSHAAMGLLIGGVLPAICFGLSSVLAKASSQAGIGAGLYTMILGLTVFCSGVVLYGILPDRLISLRSTYLTVFAGATWAVGASLLIIALNHYGSPISKLVPLYNTNTLVAVVLGLWVFSEWQELNVAKLLIGTVLVIVGGVLVSNA